LVVHCLGFGPIMPLLYPLGCVGLLYQYASAKHLLLHICKTPAKTGAGLARIYYSSILLGLVLQVAVQLILDLTIRAPAQPPFPADVRELQRAAEVERLANEAIIFRIFCLLAILLLQMPAFETALRNIFFFLFFRCNILMKKLIAEPTVAFNMIKQPTKCARTRARRSRRESSCRAPPRLSCFDLSRRRPAPNPPLSFSAGSCRPRAQVRLPGG
jgi:hypothetical protein